MPTTPSVIIATRSSAVKAASTASTKNYNDFKEELKISDPMNQMMKAKIQQHH